MFRVRVDGGDVRMALRKMKRLIEKDGFLKEARRHEYYEKPSEQRRRVKIRNIKSIIKNKTEFPDSEL